MAVRTSRTTGSPAPSGPVRLTRAERRLLLALAPEGTWASPAGQSRLHLHHGGGAGPTIAESAGAALVAHDLAAWAGEGSGRQLVATDAGRARARREAAALGGHA